MKKINILLPAAFEALKNSGLVKNNSISKEYDGYVAAFGPSVRTAGLLVTLAFFSDGGRESREGKTKRVHVLNILRDIYKKKNILGTGINGEDLLKIALDINRTQSELYKLKLDLIDCATALKLVMRNYNQVENASKTDKSENTQPNTQP